MSKISTNILSIGTVRLLGLLLVAPMLLLSPFDFWDGRILHYALETQQTLGVRDWFMTSGWWIQNVIYAAIQMLQNETGLPGSLMMHLIMLFALCGLIRESYFFAIRAAHLPQAWALVAAASVAVFPAWSALLSSVTFIYILCSWLVLVGLRLIFQAGTFGMLGGFVLMVASFQLNSNFVFSMALAMAYCAALFVRDGQIVRAAVLRLAAVVITSIAAYVLWKTIFTSSGIYAQYNRIHLSADPARLLELCIAMLTYFQYVLLLGFGILLASGCMMLAAKRECAPQEESRSSWQRIWPVLLSLFLVASAAFPYALVGKVADLRAVLVEWNPRHTFLLAMPVGLFTAGLAYALSQRMKGLAKWLPAIAALMALALIQQAAFYTKASRAATEAAVIAALKEQPVPPPAGEVKLVIPALASHYLRYYESNWLLAKAYGAERWVSDVVPSADRPVRLPQWMREGSAPYPPAYLSKHLMREYEAACETVIHIAGEPFSPQHVLGWWLLGTPLPDNAFTVQSVSAECPETM